MQSVAVGRAGNAVLAGHMKPEPTVRCASHKASIFALLLCSRPSAIFGRIAFGIFDAINREVVSVSGAMRPLAECFVCLPFIADRNVSISWVTETATTPKHILPYLVKARASLAVASAKRANSSSFLAPATFGFAVPEIGPVYRALRAAFATAIPERAATRGVSVLMKHMPKTKGLAGDVNQSGVLSHVS